MQFVFAAFRINALRKVFVSPDILSVVHPNKPENFPSYVLFNHWEVNNEETSVDWTGGGGLDLYCSATFRCSSLLQHWIRTGLLWILSLWILFSVQVLPAVLWLLLLSALLLVRWPPLLPPSPSSLPS